MHPTPLASTSPLADKASCVLAEAFEDDPMMLHAFPDEAERRRSLDALQRMVYEYGRLFGSVDVAPDADGIAIWLPPGEESMTASRMARAGMAETPFILGLRGLWRLTRFASRKSRLHQEAVKEPHWYLVAIAVAKSCQGSGLGSKLLRLGLERADAKSEPCYLETTRERNVRFFARHGFTVAAVDSSSGGPRIWGMARPALPAPAAT